MATAEPASSRLDPLHLADRDAGDAHVGFLGELGRLVERDLEAVALRLERDRAAEGDPEEERQREAREREADRDQDPCGCRRAGFHQLRISRRAGRPVGLASWGRWSSAAA